MKTKILTLLWTLCVCEAYKILLVFTFSGKSHIMLGHAYVRILLKAGHEVTYITPDPMAITHKNLHQVPIRNESFPDVLNMRVILNNELDLSDLRVFVDLANKLTREVLTHDNVQKLMNDPTQKFDLVIGQWLYNEIYSAFSVVFDCPFIWAGPTEPHPFILGLIDDAPNPAYMSDLLSYHVPPLTFFQHLKELWVQFFLKTRRKFFDPQPQNYKELIGPVVAKKGRKLPPYDEVKYNASFILFNSHYSIGQASQLPQNSKLIGGYHIDTDNIIPLQKDLRDFMNNNSLNGVIYFSMGSVIKSKDMPEQVKKDLLKMFGQLKQSVIWTFEEKIEDVPKNVYILKWAPQMSILAHPNCRLFITHGGLLSTIETIHNGIPIIGIPMFADQFINVKRAVVKGFAKQVDFTNALAEDLKCAIKEILDDPRYVEKAKELSMIYHDRPIPPHKELVHWVEHVVRTRGAAHLRSPALVVPWYQKMYLDVVILIVLIIASIKLFVKQFMKLFTKEKNTKQKVL